MCADQLILQPPVFQRIDVERLLIFAARIFQLKVDVQPLAEETAHRIRQEIRQLTQRQCAFLFHRLQRLRCHGSGFRFQPGAPFVRITEQRAALTEIVAVERLQTMFGGQGVQ
ncbi:hypothetical protein SRABI106_02608 [Rahnella aquatilis]|nr:hypothetical protein SRABI106_02608 [Rahnella aquatilis]